MYIVSWVLFLDMHKIIFDYKKYGLHASLHCENYCVPQFSSHYRGETQIYHPFHINIINLWTLKKRQKKCPIMSWLFLTLLKSSIIISEYAIWYIRKCHSCLLWKETKKDTVKFCMRRWCASHKLCFLNVILNKSSLFSQETGQKDINNLWFYVNYF